MILYVEWLAALPSSYTVLDTISNYIYYILTVWCYCRNKTTENVKYFQVFACTVHTVPETPMQTLQNCLEKQHEKKALQFFVQMSF